MGKKAYTFLSGDQEYYFDDERIYSFDEPLKECILLHVVSHETELGILLSPNGRGYLDFGRNPEFMKFLTDRNVQMVEYQCETIGFNGKSEITLNTNALALLTIEVLWFSDGCFISINNGKSYKPIKEYPIPDRKINFLEMGTKDVKLIEEKEYGDGENLPDQFFRAASKSNGCLVLILAVTSAVLLALNLI